MGRPKLHDEHTAETLLAAAERTLEREGIGGLSLRSLAAEASTSTRAVYSLFGSKQGLVAALGARAFQMLNDGLGALPATRNPQRDLLGAALMFRRFAIEHPVLFAVAIQRTTTSADEWARFRPHATAALDHLVERIGRLEPAGLLRGRSPRRAAAQFHALCEGLAALELRGGIDEPEWLWHEAVSALVHGFAQPPLRRPRDGSASRARRGSRSAGRHRKGSRSSGL